MQPLHCRYCNLQNDQPSKKIPIATITGKETRKLYGKTLRLLFAVKVLVFWLFELVSHFVEAVFCRCWCRIIAILNAVRPEDKVLVKLSVICLVSGLSVICFGLSVILG
jgi:hypothetical protein